MKAPISLPLVIVVFLFSITVSCKQKDKTVYKIQTGAATTAAEKTISSAGGNISINEPGHVLNGFSLEIPESGYDDELSYKISYAPVTEKELGNGMTIVSPLISIENGGEYSNIPMTVKIPLSEPQGKHAMGFIYDEATGQLEGLPMLSFEDNSITVMTRHFSKIIALYSKGDDNNYLGNFDSGFKPGVDDWQLGNPGRIENAVGGQCSGESMGMLWYFREKRMKDKNAPPLNGLFESDGVNITPGFWHDDVRALKFCAIIQSNDEDIRWDDEVIGHYVDQQKNLSDEKTMQLFADAFRLVSQPSPQFIHVSNGKSSHAMVVYKMEEGTLYIADPNYPGSRIVEGKPVGLNRKIVYDQKTKKYKPYTSGKTTFDNFTYLGESALVPFKKIESLWPSLQSGKFDKKFFPDYTLKAFDEYNNPSEFKNGHTLRSDGILAVAPFQGKDTLKFIIYDENKRYVRLSEPLSPGIHKVGIEVYTANYNWIGFDWIEILVPERRIKDDQPHEYHGKDFSAVVTLDGQSITIDSIVFNIIDNSQCSVNLYDKDGPDIVHMFSFSIFVWHGTGNYPGVLSQYMYGVPSLQFFGTQNGTVDITQWGGGILSGNFSYEARDHDLTRNVTCSFRYPK
jgi:hypothetical protein